MHPPFRKTPFGTAPRRRTPSGTGPTGGAPLSGAPLEKTPFGKAPFGGTRFRAALALVTSALLTAGTLTLAKGEAETGEPMSLAVLPDRSVLHTSRDGDLRMTDSAGDTRVVGSLPVYTHDEEGLQGIGVDPGFERNRFLYLLSLI
uniref:PQQ-dependent sugar dehydrogenase n=3 Tax=Streptomyces clavuligerus TaxID=1901 RepID=UPI0018D010DC